MNLSYIKNIPFVAGELTIVKSDNAAAIMKHSCNLATEAKRAGMGTLIVNTGMSKYRFRQSAEDCGIDWDDAQSSEDDSQRKAKIRIYSTNSGNLVSDCEYISQLVEEGNIGFVVISSYEWASSSWRRKESLQFALRRLMDQLQVPVIIYTQTSTSPETGKVDRGGTGKLATIACAITSIDSKEVLAEVTSEAVADVPEEITKADFGGGAQLVGNKINGLQILKSNFAYEKELEDEDDLSGEHRRDYGEDDDYYSGACAVVA